MSMKIPKCLQLHLSCDIMKTVFACSLVALLIASSVATDDATGFIIGGRDAELGQFPHMVSIRYQAQPNLTPSHGCGGGILNRNWVITVSE